MDYLTTDAEVSAAVAAWMDAHPSLPSELIDEPIVVFKYVDGTGGAIRWDGGNGWFLYFYRTDRIWNELKFTPEVFRDCAGDIMPLLHREAERSVQLLDAH